MTSMTDEDVSAREWDEAGQIADLNAELEDMRKRVRAAINSPVHLAEWDGTPLTTNSVSYKRGVDDGFREGLRTARNVAALMCKPRHIRGLLKYLDTYPENPLHTREWVDEIVTSGEYDRMRTIEQEHEAARIAEWLSTEALVPWATGTVEAIRRGDYRKDRTDDE